MAKYHPLVTKDGSVTAARLRSIRVVKHQEDQVSVVLNFAEKGTGNRYFLLLGHMAADNVEKAVADHLEQLLEKAQGRPSKDANIFA